MDNNNKSNVGIWNWVIAPILGIIIALSLLDSNLKGTIFFVVLPYLAATGMTFLFSIMTSENPDKPGSYQYWWLLCFAWPFFFFIYIIDFFEALFGKILNKIFK